MIKNFQTERERKRKLNLFDKIISTIIIIGVGLFIIHKSFDFYGMKKYNEYSLWGKN